MIPTPAPMTAVPTLHPTTANITTLTVRWPAPDWLTALPPEGIVGFKRAVLSRADAVAQTPAWASQWTMESGERYSPSGSATTSAIYDGKAESIIFIYFNYYF